MGPINKEAIYDIIWVEPDKCHVMIARPDNFYEISQDERDHYFLILKQVANGSASALAGTNASTINLEEVISNQVNKNNQRYEEFLKGLE